MTDTAVDIVRAARRHDAAMVAAAVFTLAALAVAHHFGTLDRGRLGAGDAPTEVAIAAEGGDVWVTSWDRRSLRRLDPRTREARGALSMLRRPFALAEIPAVGAVAVSGRLGSDVCVVSAVEGDRLAETCHAVAERIADRNGGAGLLSPSVLGMTAQPPSGVLAVVEWHRTGSSEEWGVVRLEASPGDGLEKRAESPHLPFLGRPRMRALVASDPASGWTWAAPSSDPRVVAFDENLRSRAELFVTATPSALALDGARGRGFVAIAATDEVRVVDDRTLAFRTAARVGHGPVALALRPGGGELWVLLRGDRAVVVLDPSTLRERRRIALEGRPWSMAADWTGGRLWITEPDLGRVDARSLEPGPASS